MTVGDLDLQRLSRSSLIDLIGCLRTENFRIQRDLDDVCKTLRLTQERCTELLLKSRGLVLPGWFCVKCGAFNGEAKESRTECRACA